jgi:hypothetical protein
MQFWHIFQTPLIFLIINRTPSHVITYNPRADGAKLRARVLIPPGYLHPGKGKH